MSSEPTLRDLSALRGWRGQLSALWGFTIREYFIWQSYRSRQIMWVLDILTNSLIFFILGRLVGRGAAHLLGPYGTNYITFILIGMLLDYFLITNLADSSGACAASTSVGRWTCTCSRRCTRTHRCWA